MGLKKHKMAKVFLFALKILYSNILAPRLHDKAEKADAGPILSQPQAGSQYMDEHFQHRRDEYFKTIPLRYYISSTCLSLKCALRKDSNTIFVREGKGRELR